jgi:hypothetical protein
MTRDLATSSMVSSLPCLFPCALGPQSPWTSFSAMPQYPSGHDIILVIVDRLHGLPADIVSDPSSHIRAIFVSVLRLSVLAFRRGAYCHESLSSGHIPCHEPLSSGHLPCHKLLSTKYGRATLLSVKYGRATLLSVKYGSATLLSVEHRSVTPEVINIFS